MSRKWVDTITNAQANRQRVRHEFLIIFLKTRSYTLNYVSARFNKKSKAAEKGRHGPQQPFFPDPSFWPWYTFRYLKNSNLRFILFALFTFNVWRSFSAFVEEIIYKKIDAFNKFVTNSFDWKRWVLNRRCEWRQRREVVECSQWCQVLLEDDAKKCSSSQSCKTSDFSEPRPR